MKLWIDADATPRDVKDIVVRAADRLKLDTIFVANQRVDLAPGSPTITAVRVQGGPDVADRYIADHAAAGDIAVTQDIPLAAILVAAGVMTIGPRGEQFTEENIGERLSVRDFMEGLRAGGTETGGPSSFGPKDKQAFASTLDRVLSRALRGR